jgi:hypothetical protein
MTMMDQVPTTNSMPSQQNSDSGLSSKDEQKIVAWVNEKFVQMKNARVATERQWYLNLAFYFGRQNVQFLNGNDKSFKLYTPQVPYYRSRPIINLIRPLIRTEMSKLTSQKPNAFITPASSDDRDMYAAQAGEQIWDYIFREKKLHSVIRRAVFWSTITGNGFVKSWWDTDKEDIFSNQLGDICYEPVTPFHLYVPELREEEIEEQPYVFQVSSQSADKMSLMFGKEVAFQKQQGEGISDSFLNVMGISEWEKSRKVITIEAWIKPGEFKMFPQGSMVTIAGNKVIQYTQDGMPYLHGKYPYAHFAHVQTGKFYRESVVNDLIPLQREYNRTRGQIIEAKNRMAKPQLAAEQGSIDPGKITSEPGQIVLYRPGFQPPQPIPLQPLPSYVLEEQDRIKGDMNEISGQHEVSRGQVPPGVTAATAISYLQEQDESKLSYTYDSIEEGVEKLGYMTLNYVKQYWDTKRKVKITGSDGSFDVLTFEGSDLRDNTDIRVEAGSALPVSRAAKQAFIMDLMKFGWIDPQKGLEVMEIGGINKIYETIQIDVRQAQRENLKMAQVDPQLLEQHHVEELNKFMQTDRAQQLIQDQMIMEGPNGDLLDMSPVAMGQSEEPQPIEFPLIVPVNTWDDHRLHIERHNNYRKTQAYEELTQEAKDLFEQHVRQHVSAIMVGAAGALPPETLTPEMMDAGNNPEAFKEMDRQAPPEQQGQGEQV